MLRVAIYYESRLGRNDGNPVYVTGSLKRMQEKGLLEVDHLAPMDSLKPFGRFDLNFWVDWGEDGLGGIMPYKYLFPPARPLVYWASDTHLGYDYRLSCAKQSDLVFVAQKDAVERFKRDGVIAPVYWLPHAVEPIAYCDRSHAKIKQGSMTPIGDLRPYNFASKKYDVSFVGHVSSENRMDALDRLFREFPNFFYGQRLFNDAAEIYAQSKICFNIAMKNDLNMRCFEVLGSKSFLLTDRVQGIEDHFKDGEHLVLWDSLDDMVEKARYYLTHDEERDRITQSGYEHVMKYHTIDHRVNFMLEKACEHSLIQEELNVH